MFCSPVIVKKEASVKVDPTQKKKPKVDEEKEEKKAPVEKEEEEEDEDIDPLDAYMVGIREEVMKNRGITQSKVKSKNDKVTVVIGVARKGTGEVKNKGEVIEQNQDALDYSSGDDRGGNDDLASAMDNLGASKTKQKKPLTISAEDIDYEPFRKNFYIEVPEITKMTNEEVEQYKRDMEGIKTKGKGCPRPIKTWAQCGTSKKVLEILKRYVLCFLCH